MIVRAACLCTFSSISDIAAVQLSNITDPYSNKGRIKEMYMTSLVDLGTLRASRFKRVTRFIAAVHLSLIWSSHVM